MKWHTALLIIIAIGVLIASFGAFITILTGEMPTKEPKISANELIDSYDVDGNKLISYDEFSGLDKYITKTTTLPHLQNQKLMPITRFIMIDENEDSYISENELSEILKYEK